MEIKIDPEFKSLIPGISEDELKGLEQSLLDEGCRDPLVLWDDILLDGHNRLDICTRHEISFKTIGKTFDNRDQAKIWIICNQLSRRNLTPEDKTYLIGIQYKLEKKEVGGQLPRKGGDQNEPALRTAEKIAEQHNISPATVKRAEKFADALDKLPTKEKQEVLSGKSGKTKKEIINPKSRKEERQECEKKRKLEQERMAPEFKKAFEKFYEEVRKAKSQKWEESSKKAALNCIQWLHDLITIT
jgi:hypothetical protein